MERKLALIAKRKRDTWHEQRLKARLRRTLADDFTSVPRGWSVQRLNALHLLFVELSGGDTGDSEIRRHFEAIEASIAAHVQRLLSAAQARQEK